MTNFFLIQGKLEGTMQMIVHQFERGEAHSLLVAAALARSGLKDCQQATRMILARIWGRGIIERSNDDERPKSLTPENFRCSPPHFTAKNPSTQVSTKKKMPPQTSQEG